MKKITTRLMLFLGSITCLSMMLSSSGIIEKDYTFLVGEYELIVAYNDQNKPIELPQNEKFTLSITKKDILTFYRNGKKMLKYTFVPGRAPMAENEQYILFKNGPEHFPMYFKGDTVIAFVYPYEFNDNYFRKVSKKGVAAK